MRSLLWALGILFGFLIARALDAGWVMFFHVGARALPFPIQAAIELASLAAFGLAAGIGARWLAGWTSTGVAPALALALLFATGVDLALGIANEPGWHEALTVLAMVPAAAFGGGFRPGRRGA